MVKYEDFCVDCEWCRGIACPYAKKIPVYYCDDCGEEIVDDEVYEVDSEELCEHCLKERFRKK